MTTVYETYNSGAAFSGLKECVFGLECEVESIANGGKSTTRFKCVQDGSLRNNGWEYTTMFPNYRVNVVDEFKGLYKELKLNPKSESFTERTSTHVHVNVSSMDVEHARQMILLYSLYEEFFFALVKPCRRDNIHCVPLTETHLPSKYSKSLHELIQVWSKYTALNLGRLHDLGTMEFRHLHGTNNPEELNEWLHVLENLWKLSQRIIIDAEALGNHKKLEEWFELLFFPSNKVMMLKPSLFSIIRNSLIDVKMSVAS